MKQRYCHKCNEPLMIDQDICQVCGALKRLAGME
jgi:RNA polymerase subunit RPABC4/transcription elongation factor Spt4